MSAPLWDVYDDLSSREQGGVWVCSLYAPTLEDARDAVLAENPHLADFPHLRFVLSASWVKRLKGIIPRRMTAPVPAVPPPHEEAPARTWADVRADAIRIMDEREAARAATAKAESGVPPDVEAARRQLGLAIRRFTDAGAGSLSETVDSVAIAHAIADLAAAVRAQAVTAAVNALTLEQCENLYIDLSNCCRLSQYHPALLRALTGAA